MSERAMARLRVMWQQLEFFTVERTSAREPEDVLEIVLREQVGTYPSGEPMLRKIASASDEYTRLLDVPPHHREHALILWWRFHGFTAEGIRFDSAGHNTLSYRSGGEGWLRFHASGHTDVYRRPKPGQLICGIAKDHPGGRRLAQWFVCDEAFKLLVTIVREGTDRSEAELGRLLLLKHGFADSYWAIARLVVFDNVQAFVDCIKIVNSDPTASQPFMGELPAMVDARPDFGRHPAFGQPHGHHQLPVDWHGMYIGASFAGFVHELSYVLDEPDWWQELLRLTDEQGVLHSHPYDPGTCIACLSEEYRHGRRYPYRRGPDAT